MPIRGEDATRGLWHLAANFDHIARPKRGRYVHMPAITDEQGIVSLPPAAPNRKAQAVELVAAGLLAGFTFAAVTRRRNRA